jgi:hypothetical protein
MGACSNAVANCSLCGRVLVLEGVKEVDDAYMVLEVLEAHQLPLLQVSASDHVWQLPVCSSITCLLLPCSWLRATLPGYAGRE